MGTDRYTFYKEPCLCGEGLIKIDNVSPDHMYYTGDGVDEPAIECKKCNAIYAVQQRGKQFVVVERAELAKIEDISNAVSALEKKFVASPAVQNLLKDVAKLLDAQPSKAAVHSLLQHGGFHPQGYATFIKKWKGGKSWVKSNSFVFQLERLMALVKSKDAEMENGLAEIEALRGTMKAAPIVQVIYESKS